MRGILTHYLKSCMRLLPIALIIAFIFGIIGPSTALANPGWYNTSWLYRKQITINAANVTATLTDFPVMISITSDPGLGTHAQLDGDDILFTASDEITKLSHEIEKYSSNGVTANLTAWVKIPSLSSISNTVIYMYYGNSGVGSQQDAVNVWDSNFKMVQHMEETVSGAGAIKDSTSNSNNGTDINGPTLGATGKIDGAITFDGSNDNIQVPDSNSLDITGSITVQAWVSTTNNNLSIQTILEKRPLADTYNYYMRLDNGYLRFGFNYNNASTGRVLVTDNTYKLQNNTWTLVAATYNQTNVRLYINGNQVFSVANNNALLANAGDLYIGKEFYDTSQFFNGGIDEIRISSTARSADWLKTSYNNQNNPSAFFLPLGPEQNVFVAPTVTTDNATLVEETTATLNGILNSDGGEACQFSFEWGTSPSSYTANISWTGSITTGQSFSANITGLDKGQAYYFRAKVKNSVAAVNGSEVHFLTKPDGPEALNATASSSSQIDLSWAMGTGAGNTMVRGKLGSYPTSHTDGYEVYFGASTNASDSGLSDNTTYFYRAWSEKTGSQQWSDTFSSASATTNAAPSSPTVIGGKVFSVNKAMILAPWLGLALAFAMITTYIVMYIRKKTPPRPPPKK